MYYDKLTSVTEKVEVDGQMVERFKKVDDAV